MKYFLLKVCQKDNDLIFVQTYAKYGDKYFQDKVILVSWQEFNYLEQNKG